jgi:hypothetical protein
MPKQARWSIKDTVAISNTWQPMGKAIQNKLSPRGIDTAFFDTLSQATVDLEDAAAGRLKATGNQKASTRELEKVIKTTADWISLVRQTMKRLFPKETGLLTAVGVGNKAPLKNLPRVIEATDQLIEGLERYPSFAAAANVLPADIARLKQLRAELRSADALQEDQKGKKKGVTASVKSIHQDVIAMLDRLYTSVMLSHTEERHVVEQFRTVIPTRRASKKVTPPSP